MTAARPIFLYGCGGHGRVLLDAALSAGIEVTGILDVGLEVGRKIFGVPVLGGNALLGSAELAGASWLNGIGANPDLTRRRAVFDRLSENYAPLGVQHVSVITNRLGAIGKGVQLMAGVVIQNGTSIGDNVIVNTGAKIDHDCWIGAHGFLAPGSTLCGNVTLGEGVFVGAGAIIVPGVTIGSGAIVGAGSVVIKDVPSNTTVVGNPAKMKKAE